MPRVPSVVVLVVTVLTAARADAQVIHRPMGSAGPDGYVFMGAGFFQSGRVDDGTTGSSWDFGNGVQYRVTLEKAIQNQSSVGIAATFGRLPLVYSSATDPSCASCNANATVSQLLGTFHVGGDQIGVHQVIDLDLGATLYSDFRERTTGRKLAPSSDADVAFGVGYGFGYTMSPDFQLELVEQFGGTVHQRTGLSGNADTIIRSLVTRIGVRFGLGSRRG